jgi:hypothetical protein
MAFGRKMTGFSRTSRAPRLLRFAGPALLPVLLAGAASVGACSSSVRTASGEPTSGSTSAALDAPNGGISPATAESPAFADPEVEALPVMDSTLATAVDPTDPTAALAATSGATAYRLALVWGHLPVPHDADATDVAAAPEDWTGSISVAAGAIGLKRTIAFDVNDHIDPRANAQTLSFTSHTLPYVDGVLVRVVIPNGAIPSVHFATTALTTDIDLTKLAAGVGGVQRLSDDVEGLAWIGFPEDGCARGFIHGRWVKSAPALGRLVGVVSDSDGNRIGDLRGLWGHAPKRDANVWFAKYIGVAGDARGLAFGNYGDGTFDGLWGAADESHTVDVGTTEGFYSDADDTGDGRGIWVGRWAAKCAN